MDPVRRPRSVPITGSSIVTLAMPHFSILPINFEIRARATSQAYNQSGQGARTTLPRYRKGERECTSSEDRTWGVTLGAWHGMVIFRPTLWPTSYHGYQRYVAVSASSKHAPCMYICEACATAIRLHLFEIGHPIPVSSRRNRLM